MSIVTTPPETTPPQEKENVWALRMFLGGIAATLLLVGGSLALISVARQNNQHAAAQARLQAMIDQGVLMVHRVDEPMKQPDPFAAEWADAPIRQVDLKPQNLTMPAIEQASVAAAQLQAMTDGRNIAFRLSWADDSVDWNVDAARFTDAAAIQLPLDPDASFMMGGRQSPVQIIHWKALWQKDIDEHFQDVQDVHPNYWTDLYWFAQPTGKPSSHGTPYRVPESFQAPISRQWFAAHQARNPMSGFVREQPVEELIAEGFGSLISQEQSDSRGRGVWRDGRWHVVFMRPLRTTDREDVQFDGLKNQVGVAIWDGSSRNVGGRKQYSDWIPMQEKP